MKKAIKIIVLLAIAVGWMVGIFKLSGMTSKNSNGESTDLIYIFIEDTLDVTNDLGITNSNPSDAKLEHVASLINAPLRKVIHATVYFVLAFFVMVLLNVIFEHRKYALSFILALIICAMFAASDEFHQTFVAGRTGQVLDVLIDSTGAVVGLLFYTTYHIVYKNGYRNALEISDKQNQDIEDRQEKA